MSEENTTTATTLDLFYGVDSENDSIELINRKLAVNQILIAMGLNPGSEENFHNSSVFETFMQALSSQINKELLAANKLNVAAVEDIACYGGVLSGYNINGNTTSDWGANNSELFPDNLLRYSSGMTPLLSNGQALSQNDVGHVKMPRLINGNPLPGYDFEYQMDDFNGNSQSYPHRAYFIIPIRNQTSEDITFTYSFTLSNYTGTYSSGSVWLYVPNVVNANIDDITQVAKSSIYYSTSSTSDRDSTVEVTVPADKTVVLIQIGSGRFYTDGGAVYSFNIVNIANLNTIRNTEGILIDVGFLNNMGKGYKIDIEGTSDIMNLFKYYEGITNG